MYQLALHIMTIKCSTHTSDDHEESDTITLSYVYDKHDYIPYDDLACYDDFSRIMSRRLFRYTSIVKITERSESELDRTIMIFSFTVRVRRQRHTFSTSANI